MERRPARCEKRREECDEGVERDALPRRLHLDHHQHLAVPIRCVPAYLRVLPLSPPFLRPNRTMSAFSASAVARSAAAAPRTAHGKPRTMEPMKKMGNAAAQCSTQGHAYAQCIFAAQFGTDSPGGVERDLCRQEFLAFKQCVQEKVRRRAPGVGWQAATRQSTHTKADATDSCLYFFSSPLPDGPQVVKRKVMRQLRRSAVHFKPRKYHISASQIVTISKASLHALQLKCVVYKIIVELLVKVAYKCRGNAHDALRVQLWEIAQQTHWL